MVNWVEIGNARLALGDCLDVLRTMADQSVQCCVTSPPYFGLRDYGHDGQIGLEQTPEEYVAKLVDVFREVRRVLRDDGTLWLNLGDSYSTGSRVRSLGRNDAGRNFTGGGGNIAGSGNPGKQGTCCVSDRLEAKQLLGIPWRVALALQSDGWYLRQDIIWAKPNPMPESVTDRCTKAHEYLFLLAKSARYYFDAAAIKEQVTQSTVARMAQNIEAQHGSDRVPGKTNGPMKAVRSKRDSFKRDDSKRAAVIPGQSKGTHRPDREESDYNLDVRNKRSVWTVATQPYKAAHFATFPPALIEPCVLAGCPVGGTVLDPFGGSGTTGEVSENLGRASILIELSPSYVGIAADRIRATQPGLPLRAIA